MSEFRNRVANGMINAVGHPRPTYRGLRVLQDAMGEKILKTMDTEAPADFIDGLTEMRVLVSNLCADLAREYGIEEG